MQLHTIVKLAGFARSWHVLAMSSPMPNNQVILAWARLLRAHAGAFGGVEADLKKAGFPPLSWYDVLLELRRADGGLRPMDVEQRLLIPQHNLSRLIERMVKAGYVQRRACLEDGRGHLLELTRSGRELQRRMWPSYAQAIDRHVGRRLGSEENAAQLASLLGNLVGQAPVPATTSQKTKKRKGAS